MSKASKIHDEKYKAAKAAGLPGWGGADRIAKLSQTIRERFLALDNIITSGKLLELGCGAGNLSICLSDLGFDVTGIDFSETAISWAIENSKLHSRKIDFKVADVTNLTFFASESFDVLYDGNCLHCLIGENRNQALAEWKRILKPNGILFISSLCAPLEDITFPKEFDSSSRILSESGSPYRFISTPEMIESELRFAGFKILKTATRIGNPFGHINMHLLRD